MYEGLTPEMIDEMKRFSDVEPSGFISASTNFSEGRMEEKGEFDHYIGVATTKDAWNGLDQLEVAASMWAVFTVVGSFRVRYKRSGGEYIRNGLRHRDMS